ncbi:MAG: hypothetical protein EOP81_15870 [Variovorax sp.]|nr:MAG: hypothetical protein EOP81_15870 [Variovorax sp.]
MRAFRFLAMALGVLACNTGAQAACESGLAERIHASLYPSRALDERLAACKAWPAYPGRIVVVLPMPRTISGSGARMYDLEVLLVQRPDNGNTDRDRVTARLFQPDALEDDGLVIEDIRIDTARYVLATDARAFGLRVRYRGGAGAHRFASETLRLYLPQEKDLREVLPEIEIDRDSGEWDAACNGQTEQLRTMLSTARTSSEGFADLALARTVTRTRAQRQDDGACLDKPSPAEYSRALLRYDGAHFRVPKSLRAP